MILNIVIKIFILNYNYHNFISSFNLNIYDICHLKLNNSLKENFHKLNEASQNINNTENKNLNEKTCSYSKDKKESNYITIIFFKKIMKSISKYKNIIKYKKNSGHYKFCLLFLSKIMFCIPNLISN
jgi:phage-related tail protein